MKTQHQIKFKKRTPKRKRTVNAKVIQNSGEDIVKAQVVVGERELQFARALSDTEKTVREASLESLREWLKENAESLSSSQLDKLWKGIFYCIWMADKRPIIAATVQEVVNLSDIVGWPFLEALFSCLIREWMGIDHHRIDKYYQLINAAIEKCVIKLTTSNEKKSFKKALVVFMNILSERVWIASRKGGLGVALHVLDNYIEKIVHPLLIHSNNIGKNLNDTFDIIMDEPLKRIWSSEGHLHSMGKRIRDRILRRLPELLDESDLKLEQDKRNEILTEIASKVFTIAADKNTSDDIRKDLYDVRLELQAAVISSTDEKEN